MKGRCARKNIQIPAAQRNHKIPNIALLLSMLKVPIAQPIMKAIKPRRATEPPAIIAHRFLTFAGAAWGAP